MINQTKNGEIYLSIGNLLYQNLRTGVKGTVSDEAAQKTFVINVPLSVLCGEFPELKMFINKLDLRLENSNV